MEERDWLLLKVLFIQKNITKTAEKLFISQPSLTKRLSQIEKEFETQIVIRESRGIQFTSQGEYLAKKADEMLQYFEEVRKNVLDMKEKVCGTLKVGVSNQYTKHRLPSVLKNFQSLHPEMEFQITTGWSEDIFNMVNNKQVHIGIINGEHDWAFDRCLLLEDPLCVVSKVPFQMEELPELSRIDYQTEYNFKSVVDHWWGENFSLPPQIGIEVDRADTCMELVRNGLGYAFLSSLTLDKKENIYKIDLQDKNGEKIVTKTWMYYSKEFLDVNVVSSFVDYMKRYEK